MLFRSQALEFFNPLHSQINAIYQENIDQGINALDAGNSEVALTAFKTRSEERRVGKECSSRWSPYH